MIKRIVLAAVICSVSASVFAVSIDQKSWVAEARELVKKFGHKLKRARKEGLSEGGESKALEVCHLKAPDIAIELSDETPWTVRRTTMQTRDLDNAPDKWEAKVLEEFSRREKEGQLKNNREFYEIVDYNGKPYFRYMRAILITKSCLKCHGEHIHPQVSSQLDSLYPFDQATGYREGDLRGAYTLSRPIKD